MRSTIYQNWDDYIKHVKNLHPRKVTPLIEYFMRYTWKDAMNVVQQTLNAPASTESTPQIICEKTACNCHSIDKKNRCLQYTDYGVDSCSFRK